MKLTVREAAALLNKSPRTIRYMAKTGALAGERMGNRWVFDRDALVASDPEAVAHRATEVARMRDHVNAAVDAISPKPPDPTRGFYSVRDVGAFQVASAALARLELDGSGSCRTAADALRQCLHLLAEGLHQFEPETKLDKLLAARAACCIAVAELIHSAQQHGQAGLLPVVDALERDALGSLRGLILNAEKRRER